MHVTFFVPELFWPDSSTTDSLDTINCPALRQLLSIAKLTKNPPAPEEEALAVLFGYQQTASWAAIRHLGENSAKSETSQRLWLNADPIHLKFHQDRVLLTQGESLAIRQEEADALIKTLNANFADVGRFEAPHPDRWYFEVQSKGLIDNYAPPPLSYVTGRAVEQVLAELASAKPMRKFFNEIQTQLHFLPSNQHRDEVGFLPINALWLWGGGNLPSYQPAIFDDVWTSEPLSRGFSRLTSTPSHPLPPDAAIWFEHAKEDKSHFVEVSSIAKHINAQDYLSYRDAIESLEKNWIAPLLEALKGGRIKKLALYSNTAYGVLKFEATPVDRLKFWKSKQPFSKLTAMLAGESQ